MRYRSHIAADATLTLHLAAVLAVSIWVGLAAFRGGVDVWLLTAVVVLLLSMSLAARHLVWAIVVFGLSAYTLPRYGTELDTLLEAGLVHGAAILGFTAFVAWRTQPWASDAGTSHFAAWVMCALVAWASLSFVLSLIERPDLSVAQRHHPASLLHAAVLMTLAVVALRHSRNVAVLVALLCVLPILRTLLQWAEGIHLETDLPALAAMVMPLALLVVVQHTLRPGWRVAGAAVAVGLLTVILTAQNRGAAIGLVAGMAALWFNARRRLAWLLVGLVGGAALLALAPSAYIDRFSVLWNPQASHATAGLDKATVIERQQLWRAAFTAIRERPLLGAGPGRETEALAPYRQGGSRLVAHNSALSVALETGIVGMVLYLLLFVGTVVHLQFAIRREVEPWRRAQARMVQAALCAYLGIGLVISRHDMALAYLLVGWAVALHESRPRLPAAAVARGLSVEVAATGPDAVSSRVTAWLRVGLLIYALFIVYGSLVPLHYRPQDAALAWRAFWQLPLPDPSTGDRSDWAVNFLLLLPLSFGWRFLQGQAAGLRPLLVVVGLSLLSLSVEFLQMFFPPRTPSFNDVAAQVMGILVGLFAHVIWRRPFERWLASLRPNANSFSRLNTLLAAYLVLMLAYNLMPLDLSVSPIELYRKWRDGRVLLLPFGGPIGDLGLWLYGLATDVLLWAPVGALWTLADSHRRTGAVLLRVALAALALELGQLLVLSRVSDVTDILTATLGGWLGVGLVRGWRSFSAYGPATFAPLATRAWWAWLLLLLVLYWFPFDFQPRALLESNLTQAVQRTPFQTYFERSEFGALTEMVRRVMFFLPGGFLLALSRPNSGAWRWFVMIALAVLLEGGQLMLPGRLADPTDAALQAIGGCLGLLFGRWLLAAKATAQHSAASWALGGPGDTMAPRRW